VVILDYHLPDCSGDELLRAFKPAPWHPVIIMITTDTNPRLATRFMKLGANGYLRKPFDPRYLIELCYQMRREQALLRVEDILEARTRQLRESEARLRESEENYRLLVGNLPAVVFTGYADCSVDFYDDKIKELTGHPREEFATRQRNWRQVILPEDWPGARLAFIQALKTDKTYIREYPLRRRQGDLIWVQERSQITLQPDGRVAYVSGIFFDISERKRLEEERLRLDKLESLGVLAGGIAHNFNNLLTAMLGNVNLAALTPELPEPVKERLSGAEQACRRAQALSQQLLTFARGGAPIKKVTALVPLLKEAVALALAGSRCRAHLSLPGDLWSAEVDSGQLSQALHNILINADQAMPTGGAIAIAAEQVVLADKTEFPLPPGPYVKIAISDKGMGIDPKYLGKIFDPYFTTKQKGSGLGLASAFSIIQKHGGHITAASNLGTGATFTLYLPAASQPPAPEPESEAAPATGQGKILVMDDEPLVGEIAGSMLIHLGYEMKYAAHGAEALEEYAQDRAAGQPFDAVILDLTVPGGMGGQEATVKLLDLDPQARAIVSSGYADDPIMTHFAAHGFQGVIKKPYRVIDMAEVLAAVLGSQPVAVSPER
jgi:PAS domain S-box-containing protein